jgi:2-oxoglutarate dehydrogenase E2 component (dihydrolipoamide succinyltransferase)
MAVEVKIPPMGESITSGILAHWRVKDGEAVKRDQPLFELETDKITSEGVAETDGVISLQVDAGSEVSIGQVVATIDPDAKPAAEKESKGEEPSEPAREDKPQSEETKASPIEGPERKLQAEETPRTSPAVRRIAEESGVDPASVSGTGKGGRVTKGDMLEAAHKAESAPAAAAQPTQDKMAPATKPAAQAPSTPDGRTTRRKMTPLRARIAERLVQAKNQTAMLTTFNEVDMTAVRELRARYQEDFTKKHGVKLGFMSFFVRATVQALQEVPALNAQLAGDSIIENHYYDIGVAVSTDRGLMVPVLRDCDTASFAGIEVALGTYAKKAREGKITLDDLNGGVFTITNGGIFGSLLSTPILNPPQSAILGMHAIQDRPIALDGQVVIRPMMYLALSYDHRIVDGREAVTFLVKVKQAIEDPARLLLSV